MLSSKKGAALLQVLLVACVLAGIATFLLRTVLVRTSTARQVRRTVSSQVLVQSCMAEVNALWAAKSAEAFVRDMDECIMYCNDAFQGMDVHCPAGDERYTHTCHPRKLNGQGYPVTATISGSGGNCQIEYTVGNATTKADTL